jgi:hypothetical protein
MVRHRLSTSNTCGDCPTKRYLIYGLTFTTLERLTNMKNRNELIGLLVDTDIDNFFDRADMADYLSYLLQKGFKGYNDYTDQELLDECIDRNLIDEVEYEN